MKEYAHLLRDDPEYRDRAAVFSAKVRDVSELLAELPVRAERHPVHAKVAYHDACHLANAQRDREQPRQVLRTIPGLELVPVAESDVCCGSAGIYNLVQPDTAEELGRRKAEHLTAAQPDLVDRGLPAPYPPLPRPRSSRRAPRAAARRVHQRPPDIRQGHRVISH